MRTVTISEPLKKDPTNPQIVDVSIQIGKGM